MLDKVSDPNLRVYAVWVPMLKPPDDLARSAAEQSPRVLRDKRVSNFVDSGQYSAKALAPVLGIAKVGVYQPPAWDVYLIYSPGQVWSGASPPAPAAWQHQLSLNAPKQLKLNPDALREQLLHISSAAASVR